MRKLFWLLLAAGAIYGFLKIPAETKRRALAAIGVGEFFSTTVPSYLRDKLSISENPVAKRQKLLAELANNLDAIESELEPLSAPEPGASPPPPVPAPSPKDVAARVEKTRELLAKSDELLGELITANPGMGFFEKTSERLLDKVIPLSGSGADGVGGDAGGKAICP